MYQRALRLSQTEPASTTPGPRWVPARPKVGIPLVAGIITVALLALGIALVSKKD